MSLELVEVPVPLQQPSSQIIHGVTAYHEAGLKHKGHGAVGDAHGLGGVRLPRSLHGCGVGPVRRHAAVQRTAAGQKALLLGLVLAHNESHEL